MRDQQGALHITLASYVPTPVQGSAEPGQTQSHVQQGAPHTTLAGEQRRVLDPVQVKSGHQMYHHKAEHDHHTTLA